MSTLKAKNEVRIKEDNHPEFIYVFSDGMPASHVVVLNTKYLYFRKKLLVLSGRKYCWSHISRPKIVL